LIPIESNDGLGPVPQATLTMKTRLSFFSVALVAAFANLAHAEWKHSVEIDGRPADGQLIVEGLSARISVRGVDGSTVSIRAPGLEVPDAPRARPREEGMRSLLNTGVDNSGIGLEVSVDKADVRVVSVRPPRHGEVFEFEIPREMSLRVQSVVHGGVDVEGVEGEMAIVVTEGDIRIDGACAPLVVHSVNGKVDVRFSAFPAEQGGSINGVDGLVSVALPPEAEVDLELRTINGDIVTDLPLEVKSRNVSQWGGPRSVRATLNGGGGKLVINSINDDVVVRALTAAPE
jgi:hypothetical protein